MECTIAHPKKGRKSSNKNWLTTLLQLARHSHNIYYMMSKFYLVCVCICVCCEVRKTNGIEVRTMRRVCLCGTDYRVSYSYWRRVWSVWKKVLCSNPDEFVCFFLLSFRFLRKTCVPWYEWRICDDRQSCLLSRIFHMIFSPLSHSFSIVRLTLR